MVPGVEHILDGMEWNGVDGMQCSGVEWNGVDGMQRSGLEWNGCILVILGCFAHVWSFLVFFLTQQRKIKMSGSFQRSVSDYFNIFTFSDWFVCFFICLMPRPIFAR